MRCPNLPLKLAIVSSGQTQRALAVTCRIRETRLSDIVQGWRQARPEERQAIAAALNATVDDLFGDASQQAHA